MTNRNIKRGIISALAMVGIVLAVCGCGVAEGKNGKGAGKLVIYTAVDQVYSEPIFKQFEEETGIRVEAVYDIEANKTTGLVNRIIAEAENPVCDVFWNNEFVQTIGLQNNNLLDPYISEVAKDIPEAYKDPQGYWTAFGGRARTLLVNTQLLSEDQYPTSIYDLVSDKYPADQIAVAYPIGSRQMGLLYQSVYIGILAGLGSAFMGTVIALFLREWGHKIGRLKYFYILWAPVPPYIYALCYMQLQRELGQHYRELLGIKMVGAAPVILVEILAYIPICTLIMSRAIQNINQEELSLAVLYGTGNRALLRVVIPKLVPVFLAVSGCVFALSVTDFSIPSLFQVQVYATEIFSGYSADGMFRKAAALSLPLILVSAVVFLVLCGGMGSLRFRQAGKGAMNLRLTGAVKCMVGLGGVIGFLQFFIPVVSLFMGYSGLTGMVKTIKSFHTEFYHSIILALIAGAVCIFPSMAAGFVAFKKNYVCVLCMLFLTVPGALISIGTLQLANRLLGGTGLYRSILIPGLGAGIRYLPFALCIMIAFVKGLDLEAIKLGYAYAPSQRAFLWRIYLPYLGPGMLTGFVAVALLTMGDVSTVHLLMPPGMEPFSIKIYNYLHYGANDVVADCCFMILLTMLLVMVGIISYFERTGCKTAES